MMDAPVIQVTHLVKRFGPKMVLKSLDFNAASGEFVALLGPNGAGKTTFLRILSSLSSPSMGRVAIAGCELPRQAAAVRRRLGVVSHNPLLYGDLTAEENLIVYGRSLGSGFAARLAADNHPRYLILDAPYYNFRKVIERFIPFLPVRYVLRYHLRTDKWIPRVQCPVYILHGTKDWLIPIRHSEQLQKLNPRKITLIRIHGGRHNNLPKFAEYHNFIRDILKE